jgi:hypothetical protein
MAVWTRSLPFFARRPRGSLLTDILVGAAGGALGTLLMNPVYALSSRLQFQPQSGKPDEAEPSESPTEKIARRVLAPLGVHLEGAPKRAAGHVVHLGYGTVWGALFGALHGRVPFAGRLFGLGFGVGLFLMGDELLLPALKLTPPPKRIPLPVHLSTLAAHLVYGSATEGGIRLMRRALA